MLIKASVLVGILKNSHSLIPDDFRVDEGKSIKTHSGVKSKVIKTRKYFFLVLISLRANSRSPLTGLVKEPKDRKIS